RVPAGKTSDMPGSNGPLRTAAVPSRCRSSSRRSTYGSAAPDRSVKGCQVCPNPIELNKAINRTQQMCLGHMPFEQKLLEQLFLLDLPLARHRLPPAVVIRENQAITSY